MNLRIMPASWLNGLFKLYWQTPIGSNLGKSLMRMGILLSPVLLYSALLPY